MEISNTERLKETRFERQREIQFLRNRDRKRKSISEFIRGSSKIDSGCSKLPPCLFVSGCEIHLAFVCEGCPFNMFLCDFVVNNEPMSVKINCFIRVCSNMKKMGS